MSFDKNFQKFFLISLLAGSVMFLQSCSSSTDSFDSNPDSNSGSNSNWLIPANEVVDGGPGKDGIPSIDDPKFAPVSETNFVLDERRVLGVKINGTVHLYPYQIMDWHEIVNDEIDGEHFALTLCPLTGTGIAYNREINGEPLEFGVSGLLFRNNLIMYDRRTDSNWSQMQIRSVRGAFSGDEAETIQVVESTWETWKRIYPDAQVLTRDTGFSRPYQGFEPYGRNYITDHNNFLFPTKRSDDRLQNKTIVHGILQDEFRGEDTVVRIYPVKDMSSEIQVIQESFRGRDIVFAGSSTDRISVSFFRSTQDGTVLDFEAVQGELPVIMQDDEGNRWNIFGEAVSGPREGERLRSTESFNGYWFAFADFYPNSCIYPNAC